MKTLLASMGIAVVAVPLAIGLTCPPVMRTQSPLTAAPMRFEVASVKFAADQDILAARPTRTTGRFRWTTEVWYMLMYAYHMESWRISESPAGDIYAVYDVEATTSPDATEDQERQMLQTLLIERFNMAVHRVTKDGVQGYALTVAKDGPKMEAVKENEKASDDPATSDGWVSAYGLPGGVTIEGKRGTMLQFTERLQRLLKTSVLDQTGLTGKYNFQMEFTTGEDASDFTAAVGAVKQLGLKLEKYKGPVEFLVIDRFGPLTEN